MKLNREALKRPRPSSPCGHRNWAEEARAAIRAVHETLPADCTLEARTAAVDAAFPFVRRAHYPYKVWCRERRQYLDRCITAERGHGAKIKGTRP
ncbi:hypothetical protein [Phaeovulum sp. W22_SRMD_FR3]|uniref:hypothetical protein n=1 Tax=Phaeovulum sp. W22_SRMD_FR3 TaxID=3240274 RepID=UPI003F9DAFC3